VLTFILQEENKVRIPVNKGPKRMFGPKTGKVIGEWRKLHNSSFIHCTLNHILRGW